MPNPLARSMARLAGLAASAWVALIVPAGIALAQDHGAAHGAEEAHGAGLPQLDPTTFPPQLVWLAISFALLYVLMSKVALPKVGQVLEQRQERITADLEKAQALRDEASAVMAAYEKALADARAQAQAVIAEAAAAVSKEQADRQAAFAADLAARTKAAEQRIVAAKDQALANVRSVAVDIARVTAEKLGGIEVDEAAADAAVAAAIQGRNA